MWNFSDGFNTRDFLMDGGHWRQVIWDLFDGLNIMEFDP